MELKTYLIEQLVSEGSPATIGQPGPQMVFCG
jgi:hypothetical protein